MTGRWTEEEIDRFEAIGIGGPGVFAHAIERRRRADEKLVEAGIDPVAFRAAEPTPELRRDYVNFLSGKDLSGLLALSKRFPLREDRGQPVILDECSAASSRSSS